MGAWGVSSFENDDAQDWIMEFMDAPKIATAKEALIMVVEWDPEVYLDLPEASVAIVAAEIVAALVGKPTADLPDAVVSWVGRQKAKLDLALIPLAQQAVARVRSNSELSDLWSDETLGEEWHKVVADIETRLAPPAN